MDSAPLEDSLTSQIFKIFEVIRSELVLSGGVDDLPLDFPIVEMDSSAPDMANFLGMCHFSARYDTAADLKRCNFSQQVDRISMRVLCKSAEEGVANEGEESHYHLLRLIPTLLHEFAHVTTELGRTLTDQELSCRNRKLKRMEHFSHDDLFYDHFRRILKAAEQLGIYSLPNSPNKYNYPVLRRFDQVDLEVCPLPLCGSSKLYGSPLSRRQATEEGEIQLTVTQAAPQALNLTIINAKGVKKFVQIKENGYEALRTAIGKKFGNKGWSKLQTPQGQDISVETFSQLVKTGDTIRVM